MTESAAIPPRPTQRQAPHVPGDVAMWFFIVAELAVFALFFAAYAWHRNSQPDLFAAGQRTLGMGLALAGTATLILGSAGAAVAVHAARQGHAAGARWGLASAWSFGAVFVLLKSVDFVGKARAGLSMSSDDFWMFYFSLTFLHYLHVILGMVILALVGWRLRGLAQVGTTDASHVETAAAYWHMVDLVWLVLFALVYVAR